MLRPPSVADVPEYLTYRNDDDTLSAMSLGALTQDEATAFLRRQSAKTDREPGWRMFSVVRRDLNLMIGEAGAFVRFENGGEADIGWWLGADHRGSGYATEAGRLVLEWCFGILGVGRVTAHCLASNLASRAIMRRLGMSEEAGRRDDRGREETRAVLTSGKFGR